MRRETQNILLVLLGGALLKIGLTGAYLNYVKPSFQWLVLAAGAVMVLLALFAIARDLKQHVRASAGASGGHSHDDGHGHAHGRSSWMLMLPVLAIFLIAPPALGSDSVTRNDGRSVAQSERKTGGAAFDPLPPGDVVPITMTDFVTRSAWDDANTLNDRTVRMSGFIVHDKGSTLMARLVMGCCAADATPVRVRLAEEPSVSGYAVDSWVEVTGRIQPGTSTQANSYTPSLTVTSIKQIPVPEMPYE
ncbi:TIGR03943 family protein [Allokutzneria sp. NRRL B-24872]|uniref:TIGR03943 family putative permease subunit n=1 Tax=Allokutzneria sp. NRRL B-24872 TaxID=1137961 RepID=UPI000A39CBAA|nr:TIGR03943 family protein [Allokutzneria sp. NRRL B-24872]